MQLPVDTFPYPGGGYATDDIVMIELSKERSAGNEYGRQNSIFKKITRNISKGVCRSSGCFKAGCF